MKRFRELKKLFLFIGLGILLIAFIFKWSDAAVCYFRTLLGIAIFFKLLFLISVFRAKGFKLNLWFGLMLSGVAMILLSMLFKTTFPIPILYSILFYGAIMLKVLGLVLMLFSQRKKREDSR